jgi:hypothetical protein
MSYSLEFNEHLVVRQGQYSAEKFGAKPTEEQEIQRNRTARASDNVF